MVRRITDFLNTLAGVGLGLYLLLLIVTRAGGLFSLPQSLASGGLVVLAVPLALAWLILNGWTLVSAWRQGGLRKNLRIMTESGESVVSVGALEEILLKELRGVEDVRAPSVELDIQHETKPIVCRLRFKLRRQPDILARVDRIKRSVRETFATLFPEGVGLELHADVVGFVEDPAAAPAPAPTPDDPFDYSNYNKPADDKEKAQGEE